MPIRLAILMLLTAPAICVAQATSKPAPPNAIRGETKLFERQRPRAELSDAARKALLADLRKRYEKEPRTWPAPQIDDGVKWTELGLLPKVEHPKDNPHSAEKEDLGRKLFFDPRLSGSGQLACASCHDPDLGWADGRAMAFGDRRKELKRNTPSLLNVAHHRSHFWDGRAGSLEDQARDVLLNKDEMCSSEEHLAKSLGAIDDYAAAFEKCFGSTVVTLDRVAMALACFERTIVGGNSRFDSFVKGNKRALSDQAIAGLHLFRSDARCMNCHHGPNFSDGEFHNLGLSYYGRKIRDPGRFQVTSKDADSGRFRTPSLRNVMETRPYTHNGQFELENLLTLYNNGIPTLMSQVETQESGPAPGEKSPHIRQLGLNDVDLEDLKAFLQSLSEPRTRVRPPKLPGMEGAVGDH